MISGIGALEQGILVVFAPFAYSRFSRSALDEIYARQDRL
jgi:hypothetical protein